VSAAGRSVTPAGTGGRTPGTPTAAPPVGATDEDRGAPDLRATVRDATDRLASPGSLDGIALLRLAADLDDAADRAARLLGARPDGGAAATLVDLGRLQRRVRRLEADRRFSTIGEIYASIGRLRRATTIRDLLDAAPRELGRSCGFDRAVVSGVHGSSWRAEAVWIDPAADPDTSASTRRYLTERWLPLRPGTLEVRLVQRRTAALVEADAPDVDAELVAATGTRRYVAAPVIAADRVVGFLQADRLDESPPLRPVDRDNLWTFAEEFGLVFERLALLERLDRRRGRVREVFAAADDALRALREDEVALVSTADEADASDPAGGDGGSEEVRMDLLSAREHEVLRILATGASNAGIAERLGIGEGTVRSHLARISRKLRASGRAALIARYLRITERRGTRGR